MTSGLNTSGLKKATGWVGLCGWLLSATAHGVTQEIRAVYIPDPSNPQVNAFVNQTPQSGYCTTHSTDCAGRGLSGLRIALRFASVQALEPGAPDRSGAMVKVPAQWRNLVVRHVFTGETANVAMRIGGFGSTYVLSDTATHLTGEPDGVRAHNVLWGGSSWLTAPPCQPSASGVAGDNNYRFFWFTPTEMTCIKRTAFPIPWMTYSYLDMAYELQTPDPLKMSAGLYTGELIYGVGPGMDFDTGDNLLPDNSQVTFHFVLDVQHALKVDIPPGGHKVALVPQGGWMAWLQQGRKPQRLFRDQIFSITSSSRFKMYFECQYGGLQSCGLRSAEGADADAQVFLSVSLPDSITDSSGQPVSRRPLSADPGAATFQPGHFLNQTQGTLHFEVPRAYVEGMLQSGKAKQYAGNVTVIWDSEV